MGYGCSAALSYTVNGIDLYKLIEVLFQGNMTVKISKQLAKI
jgi:hypothetical protein